MVEVHLLIFLEPKVGVQWFQINQFLWMIIIEYYYEKQFTRYSTVLHMWSRCTQPSSIIHSLLTCRFEQQMVYAKDCIRVNVCICGRVCVMCMHFVKTQSIFSIITNAHDVVYVWCRMGLNVLFLNKHFLYRHYYLDIYPKKVSWLDWAYPHRFSYLFPYQLPKI